MKPVKMGRDKRKSHARNRILGSSRVRPAHLTSAPLQFESLEPRSLLAALVPGPNVNVTKLAGNQDESAIIANPTNPLQLFSSSSHQSAGIFAARSINGGATWLPSNGADFLVADGNDSLALACCDPTMAWDDFGNLFLSYANSAKNRIVVAVSTDAGVSFNQISSLGTANVDQPTIVVGPGTGGAGGSVWIVWSEGGAMVASGAAVSGLGAATVGAFSAVATIPGMNGFSFGDVAIGPQGQVVTANQLSGGQGPSDIRVSTDPDGLGPLPFSPFVLGTNTNVGASDAIPAQPQRTVDAEVSLVFDRSGGAFDGRLYMAYTDEAVAENNDLNVFVRTSDNDGASWSAPIQVNDDTTTTSQFMQKLALDQTTGTVGIVWLDARSSATNTGVHLFGSASANGGATWTSNVQISQGLTDGTVAATGAQQLGGYLGLTFVDGVMHPTWPNNSNTTLDNPDGTLQGLDIYTSAVEVNFFDVDVSISGPASVGPGTGIGNAVYVVTVHNNGPSTATDLTLNETTLLQAGMVVNSAVPSTGAFVGANGTGVWTIPSLASGADARLTVTITVGITAALGNDLIGHSSTLTAPTDVDTNSSNNSASILTDLLRRNDLTVTQIESADPVPAGGNLTYLVTVRNNGPFPATGVSLSEDLTLPTGVTLVSVTPSAGTYTTNTAPDGTWSNLNLAVGASATLQIVVAVSPSAPGGANVIRSIATITAANEPPINTADDSVSTSTSILRLVDLAVSQTESIDPVIAGSGPGNTLTYVVTVVNNGPSDASGVVLTERLVLPRGVRLHSGRPSVGTFSSTNPPDITWALGNLPRGARATLTISTSVDASATDGADVIVSSIRVTAANETLLNPGNDAATTRTSITHIVIPPLVVDEVTTQFIPDPNVPGGTQLVITGNSEANEIALDLGAGGFSDTLRVRGLGDTLVNGSTAAGFNGFTSVAVNLGDGDDLVNINGTNIRGTVFLNAGLGDDTYQFAVTRVKLSVSDPGGLDTFDFANSPQRVNVDLSKSTGRPRAMGGGNTLRLFSQIENLIGSRFNDTLTGNAADNLIRGGAGNDKLNGGDGNDILLGESGNDTLKATLGFDILVGGSGADTLRSGSLGNSLLIGGTTAHDGSDQALLALLAEWSRQVANSPAPLNDRVVNLVLGGGLNGNTILAPLVSVFDDGAIDKLKSVFGNNWIFQSATDKLTGRKPTDVVS